MAYISGYEHDIFISYSHVDNLSVQGPGEGWVNSFYRRLQIMLSQRVGRMDLINIWFDNKKIDGSTRFNDAIKAGITKSALMICINSPGYHASEYCKKELSTFGEKIKTEDVGEKIKDNSRVINILLNNVPFGEWPEYLEGATGFDFYVNAEDGNLGDPIEPNSPEFISRMQKLRNTIYKILCDFKSAQKNESKDSKAQPLPTSISSKKEGTDGELITEKPISKTTDKKVSVYIGEVADTLRIPRRRLIAELEKKGYNVVAGIPPPSAYDEHETAAKLALKSSNFAVNLLDEYPGREIEGRNDICYPQKQTEIALGTDKSQLIWIPTETDFSKIEDESYKKFIQGLEEKNGVKKTYEFIRGTKGNLAKEIIDFADQFKIPVPGDAGSQQRSVLLDTHFKDQLYAFELGKALLENNVQPFINPQEADPLKNSNLMEERIKQVSKIIFLYGDVSKDWLLGRMSATLQLIITKGYSVDSFYVFMAPPSKETDEITINQKFLKINIFNNSHGTSLDNSKLKRFLDDLSFDAA